MSYLLRVQLPDRPGSLGSLATALGGVGADIVSLDVVEHRGDGTAVDDILVELPLGRMADSMVSAAQAVPGVRVQFLRRYAVGTDLHRDLEAVEAMTAQPQHAERVLVERTPGVFRADWAVLLERVNGDTKMVHASSSAPDCEGLSLPWLPLARPARVSTADWTPSSWRDTALAAVPLGGRDRPLLLGRAGGPEVLDSELARLRHLAGLALTISSTGPRDDEP